MEAAPKEEEVGGPEELDGVEVEEGLGQSLEELNANLAEYTSQREAVRASALYTYAKYISPFEFIAVAVTRSNA